MTLQVVQEVVMDGSDVNGPILDHIYSPWSFPFSCFTLKHEGSLRSPLN